MTNLILLSITLTTNEHLVPIPEKTWDKGWLGHRQTSYVAQQVMYFERVKQVQTNYTFGIIEGTNRVPLLNITKP